jgi:hypothetical protein
MATRIGQLVVINPTFSPSDIGALADSSRVMLGEFYQGQAAPKWGRLSREKVKIVAGSANYVSSWVGELRDLMNPGNKIPP